jgi:HK97 family phage major capsid protein
MSNDIAPETKGASDLGFAIDDLMRAFEAFKETNDQRLDEIERRAAADTLTTEKLDRIDRALDEHKRVVDELALKSARPSLGGAPLRSGATLQHKAAFDAYVR